MGEGLIDIHAHILPGLDDGPKDLAGSLELLKLLSEDGVQTVIATPHVVPGYFWPYDPDKLRDTAEELREAVRKSRIAIEIIPGAEIYLSPEIAQMAEEGLLPTLADSSYVLVEFPRNEVPFWAFEVLKKIQKAGYKPILAHPELNSEVRADDTLAEDLVQQGVLLQVDASSLAGKWGESPKNYALELIGSGLVHYIGSDTHSPRRPPKMRTAWNVVEDVYSRSVAEKLMVENPRRLFGDVVRQKMSG
ncbi:MAG: hypothetical protein H0Z38_04440 [Firmicutes bacterium]|nr:hypothetical protein [Bacillota bacterium]